MSKDLKRTVEKEKADLKAEARKKAEFKKPRGSNDEMIKRSIEAEKAELKHKKQAEEALKDK